MLSIFIIRRHISAGDIMEKNYKRQWRELSDETKSRISQSTSNKPKSAIHKMHIAQSMRDYWETVGHKPEEPMDMDEFLGVEK